LTDVLKTAPQELDAEGNRLPGLTHNLANSAGPISDGYILSTAPVSFIVGPGGSGKTVASVKKAILEAMRIRPGPDGVRRYTLGVWRQKYDNLWKTTLRSWWKVLPRDIPGSTFTGSSPRAAEHIVRFNDHWGPIVLTAIFRAFGEVADPDDILGNECTDVYLNEMPTLPENLFTSLVDRIGRDPPMHVIGRPGRFFGDGNAPDVTNWTYRDFYENKRDGYSLFDQPGGLEEGAENPAMGREYYENSVRLNAHRKWWVRRMVHNKPGFNRDGDLVYPAYDDDRNLNKETIRPIRGLPVVVGIDGGLTPAALYKQELGNGQSRWLAEVALDRGGMAELARAMLALEVRRFPDHDSDAFFYVCDPSMNEGDDTEDGSVRARLERHLGRRRVRLASTNVPEMRWAAVRAKLALTLDEGEPGLLLDPSCKGCRRGFNQTYAFRKIHGTNDLGGVVKSFDSHIHDAGQYAELASGDARAQKSRKEVEEERRRKREAARQQGRYSPLRRRA
jgi:hypothetical protein